MISSLDINTMDVLARDEDKLLNQAGEIMKEVLKKKREQGERLVETTLRFVRGPLTTHANMSFIFENEPPVN